MVETGKCNACNQVFQPDKKDVYKLLCHDCLNFAVKGSCPVCKSDLMYQNMGAIDGTWKCSIPSCDFTLDQQVFSSLKSNINEQKISGWKKLHEAIFEKEESLGYIVDKSKINNELEKAESIKWTHEAALEQAKINKHLNAEEVLYKKFGVKIKFTNDLFLKKGWFHQCQTDVRCVKCKEGYYELIRLPIIHYGRSFLRGLVCINCSDAVVREEIPKDIIEKLKKYTISKKTEISGEKTSNKNHKKEAVSPKNTTAEIGEIDKSKTNKEEIKERVETVLDKLKTTDDIFYLDYYYPKRNEAHHSSEFSINILKLKNGSPIFPYFMNKLNEINLPHGVAICCAPGSDSNKAASFLRILCIEFCAAKGFEDLSSCLKRNKTIGHSSYQGWYRSKSKTLKTVSLVFEEKLSGKVVVLIDDVAATGNTLLACRDILMKSDVHHVFCLSIGRTHRD